MRHRRTRRMVRVLVASVLLLQLLAQATIAMSTETDGRDLAVLPGNDAFQRTWERTDRPVANGQANRTWMWGPQAFSEVLTEDYIPVNSDITQRQVQYFDKSRMEITDPDGDSSSIWYVTNGLLVRELMTGEMQVGDQEWVTRFPAEVNVAGDADDPDGPTYATFAEHSFPASTVPENEGVIVTQRIDRSGTITNDATLSVHGVTTTSYVTDTGHHVASVFWDFIRSEGTIYVDGEFTSGPLFPNEFYATGFPISEPYWAAVRVGGTPKDVLVQCFDRRCLTYTPDNPEGWQVEAGNVGQHYYTWRYETEKPPLVESPEEVYRLAYIHRVWTEHGTITTVHTMNSDGTDKRQLETNASLNILFMSLSPDGQTIAFSAWDASNGGLIATQIYLIGIDGSNLQTITELEENRQPSSLEWSPDGSKIAFTSLEHGVSGEQYQYLYTMNADGTDQQKLTGDGEWATYATWSPDGLQIAFTTTRECGDRVVRCIWIMDADGNNPEMLLQSSGTYIAQPEWSPDGSEILYLRVDLDPEPPVVSMITTSPDATSQRVLRESSNLNMPRWDLSGERIYFAEREDNWSIFVMGSDGENVQQLTDNDHDQYTPSPPSR